MSWAERNIGRGCISSKTLHLVVVHHLDPRYSEPVLKDKSRGCSLGSVTPTLPAGDQIQENSESVGERSLTEFAQTDGRFFVMAQAGKLGSANGYQNYRYASRLENGSDCDPGVRENAQVDYHGRASQGARTRSEPEEIASGRDQGPVAQAAGLFFTPLENDLG